MTTYTYELIIRDGRSRELVTRGTVTADDLTEALTIARREAYQGLTSGLTTYGHPGEGACTGPYAVLQATLIRQEEQ